MYLNLRGPSRRARATAGLAVAAAGALSLLGACGHAPHTSSAVVGALAPGPGEHRLAGMPGGTGQAPADPAHGASPMPSMSMPNMSMPKNAPAAPTAPVAGTAVAIKNFAFAPAALKVKAGTTVTWTNQDTDAHTVTSSGSGGPLHSAALNTRATYRYTFTKPGTYAYLCTIHPFMTATVEVTP
ncbi:cupredoxin family copper-binding protein [Streptomyces sp. NPDC001228]|uniref:cupredoxin domain-containing protein n=1 Tax=Streptomyces sp. NPDC001228 TaxID=3154381 RepID=UPI0033292E7B